MTSVLVTGGNGFVGHHVVSALLDRGATTRVLALPTEDTAWLEERGVAVHRGDIREPASLTAPMRGVERVLHLAAMMDVWRPLAEYHAVNVTGTENVCRAALEAGVRRLVHMSSSSVYGPAAGRVVDEHAPPAPFHDPYPVTKAAAERIVQRMVAEDGLPAVIVRPDQIFGPGDRLHFGATADRVRARRAIIVGSGRNLLPLVYVADVVEGLMRALHDDRAVGQVYNISADRPLTQRQFLREIADALDVPPPRLHVPYHVLYAAGYVAERIGEATGSRRRPPITRFGVAFLGIDRRHAIDKARRELGYTPRVSVAEGVRLTAAWYRGERDAAPSPSRPSGAEQARGPLHGEVAIVTGASSGIGAATARELARRGAMVVLAARRAADLDDHVRAIAAEGGQAVAVPTDVSDPAQVRRLVETAVAAFGHVDAVVNNAGSNWSRPLTMTSGDDVANLLDVNLRGAMLVTRAALPGMLERRHGAVVSIGSLSGRVAMEPLYSATKYGLRGFSLALRRQLAGTGVSVSLVSPGKIRTAMAPDAGPGAPGPEVVAATVADLIVRPRREVVVPRRHYAIALLEQALPAAADVAHRRRGWAPIHDGGAPWRS